MKKILLLVFVTILCFGCAQVAQKEISENEYHNLLRQTILPIPDSTLTKKQLQLKIKLLDLLNENMYIENNIQKLNVGKEEFEKEGIPILYYDVILYQMKETNEAIKKWAEEGIIPACQLNQDSLIRITKERYWNIERPLLLKRLKN